MKKNWSFVRELLLKNAEDLESGLYAHSHDVNSKEFFRFFSILSFIFMKTFATTNQCSLFKKNRCKFRCDKLKYNEISIL